MGRLSCFPATTILSNGCSRIGYMICRRPGFTIGTAFNCRPQLKLQIYKVRGTVFPGLFKQHYYLDLPAPVAAEYFVGFINGEPVCHVAVSPLFTAGAYRATRLVVMPEWQGIGVGTKFLAAVCEYHRQGHGRCGKMLPGILPYVAPAAMRGTPSFPEMGTDGGKPVWGE